VASTITDASLKMAFAALSLAFVAFQCLAINFAEDKSRNEMMLPLYYPFLLLYCPDK
jgi:hypothetical protein